MTVALLSASIVADGLLAFAIRKEGVESQYWAKRLETAVVPIIEFDSSFNIDFGQDGDLHMEVLRIVRSVFHGDVPNFPFPLD